MLKFLKLTFVILIFCTNSFAGADGELDLSKDSKPIKDCFEPLNRATFALNQSLDEAIIEPLAKGYRKLPDPVQRGTKNAVTNL